MGHPLSEGGHELVKLAIRNGAVHIPVALGQFSVEFETGLPTRYYLPENDVDGWLLADSELQTGCPYKGFASYRDVVINGRRHPNLFWYYQAPFSEVSEVKGHLAPYSERVDLIVDGELQERPPGPLQRRTRSVTHAA